MIIVLLSIGGKSIVAISPFGAYLCHCPNFINSFRYIVDIRIPNLVLVSFPKLWSLQFRIYFAQVKFLSFINMLQIFCIGTLHFQICIKRCLNYLVPNQFLCPYQESHARTISSLSKADENLSASLFNITALEKSLSAAGEKFIFMQKLRDYVSVICEFLQVCLSLILYPVFLCASFLLN